MFTGLLAALAAIYSSATGFDVVVFSLFVRAASVGVGMLVAVCRRPTSALVLILAMLAGVGGVLPWRYVGDDQALSDVVRGLLSALVIHETAAAVSLRKAVV
jgi:hypothetical protein